MSRFQQLALAGISFFIVAFGQPAWVWWLGLLAASFGYALFFRVLLCHANPWHRFWLSTLWYTAVEWTQLSWLISHPYWYILLVHLALSALVALQFGLLGVFITNRIIRRMGNVIALSCFWVLMEWARLFFLSGFSFNPAGLALTGSVYPLQLASLAGVFGLTFWILFSNFLILRRSYFSWAVAICVPYLFGAIHLAYHSPKAKDAPHFSALLVQTAFPPEEAYPFQSFEEMLEHVKGEWNQILRVIAKHQGKQVDLLVFPEGTVPYGAYAFVFPFDEIKTSFASILGEESFASFAPMELPWAYQSEGQWRVNNVFIAQTLANYFSSGVVIGLEDAEDVKGERAYYSSAHYLLPNTEETKRYDKRVLVPMGEYIPFAFCDKLAKSYGVCASFKRGEEAKVMEHPKYPFGISICYEEMFGDMMRENKQKGAQLLVNITNDAWYPNSRLPLQHFTHSLLRTVENGFPLLRACNTGVTAGVDSLGRTVSVLEGSEWRRDALFVDMPIYAYPTLYSKLGDGLIVGFSFIAVLLFLRRPR